MVPSPIHLEHPEYYTTDTTNHARAHHASCAPLARGSRAATEWEVALANKDFAINKLAQEVR